MNQRKKRTSIPLRRRSRDPHYEREADRYERPVASREYILETLTKQGVPMPEHALERLLRVTPQDRVAFARRLAALERHLSAFHPTYKMLDIQPTPVETLEKAREIGLEEGLRYVYTGNVPGNKGESTYCWNCRAMLIERRGFMVKNNIVVDSKCPECGSTIDGVEL